MSNFTLNGTESKVTEAVCFLHDSTGAKTGRVIPYCFIIPLSLVSNSLVVAIVCKDRRMHKTVNFFIVNMSIADLLATVVYMPRVVSIWLAGYEWQIDGIAGFIFCKMSVCLNQTSIAVSIFTVVAISLDRFFAVVFPLRVFITDKISQIIILCIWMAALLASFPQFYGIKTMRNNGLLYCFLELDKIFGEGAATAFYMFIMLGLFAIPLAITVILYSAILIALLKRRRVIGDALSNNDDRLRRQERTRKKVLKMVSMVVACFILCWLLYFIHSILYSYKIIVPCTVLYLRLLLAHLNSIVNPFIYWFFNENFRRGFRSIFAHSFPGVALSPRVFPLNSAQQTNDTCSSARRARIGETSNGRGE
ncbi:neuropeptide FF receptor 2-like [Actinia tenebrosa]|uniref:Neuropeptide FF receptor 2-like n=1 Tax=Actinia tenebrosa TaxID=6105 RepID=A0A6P8HYG4_ACTTE|nr:neuropeptide FF receptor 2-like [Actinia tenebrosa]